jgi:hypothetical protein
VSFRTGVNSSCQLLTWVFMSARICLSPFGNCFALFWPSTEPRMFYFTDIWWLFGPYVWSMTCFALVCTWPACLAFYYSFSLQYKCGQSQRSKGRVQVLAKSCTSRSTQAATVKRHRKQAKTENQTANTKHKSNKTISIIENNTQGGEKVWSLKCV